MRHSVELDITLEIKEKVMYSCQKEYPCMTLSQKTTYFDQILSAKPKIGNHISAKKANVFFAGDLS